MKLKPINWIADGTTHLAVVMGVTLAVHLDKDGTYTASLSGIPNQRPEFQKLFATADKAKEYAVNTLLQREITKHFENKPDEPQKPDGVYPHVWQDMNSDELPKHYALNVQMSDMSFGTHNPTVNYLYSLGYRRTAVQQRADDFSYDIILELHS